MAWRHYVCEVKGRAASVLIDQRFQNQFPLNELPRLFWLGIYYYPLPEGSISNPDDGEPVDRVESDLISLGQSFGHGWMVHILQIRSPGIREYYFYCGEGAEPEKIVPALVALHPTYRIEVDEKLDPEWIEYKNYNSFGASSTHD